MLNSSTVASLFFRDTPPLINHITLLSAFVSHPGARRPVCHPARVSPLSSFARNPLVSLRLCYPACVSFARSLVLTSEAAGRPDRSPLTSLRANTLAFAGHEASTRGGVSEFQARRSFKPCPPQRRGGACLFCSRRHRRTHRCSTVHVRDKPCPPPGRDGASSVQAPARPGPIRREAGYDAAGRLGRAGPADKVREQGPSNIMPTWRECECPPRSGPDWRDVGRETRTRGAGGPTRAPPRPPRNPPSPARRGLEGAIGPPPPRRSGSRRSGSPAHEKGQPRRR